MGTYDYRITNSLADMNDIITVTIIKAVTKVSLVTRCWNALDEIICGLVNYRTNSNWQQSHISIEMLSINNCIYRYIISNHVYFQHNETTGIDTNCKEIIL